MDYIAESFYHFTPKILIKRKKYLLEKRTT
jgi:hypothetical protein